MGLDLPDLDDREYADILEDARKRIPVHTDEWTDHNAHDPGITILETLSWLAETYIYQLDTVTDAHREKYLKLMGAQPDPPKPASIQLQPVLPGDTTALEGLQIPEGTKLEVDDGTGTTRSFETVSDVTLTSARIETVLTIDRASLGRGDWTDNSNANTTPGMHFLAFGRDAEAGSEFYLGMAGDDDPFAAGRLPITVGFHEADLPTPARHEETDPEFTPSVEVGWEYYVEGDDGPWVDLTVLEDGTDTLYHGGTITLGRPVGADGTRLAGRKRRLFGATTALYWLRCTVRTPGYEIPPQFDFLKLSVIEARHRSTVEDETLRRPDEEVKPSEDGTRTTALPGQRFVFEHRPVLDAEIVVGGDVWTEVEDFDASGPDHEHYVLDRSRGELRFGDGIRGTMPEAGMRVVARRYAYGGGRAGNVPRSAAWRFLDDELRNRIGSATERGATPADDPGRRSDAEALAGATGGADAESLESALAGLRRDLKEPYRLVALQDYEHVATHTPGLRFGRATARAGRRDDIGSGGHGEVCVVVVPFSPLPRPVPSEGFLDAVWAHLDRHRLLTDRVTVEPPTYVGIGVDAEIRVSPDYSREGRRAAISAALDEFLSPLRGFDGDGWPFGRTVFKSDLYDVIDGVEGVDHVDRVSMRARGDGRIDGEGNVSIDDSALVYPTAHDVVAGQSGSGRRP